MKLGAVELLLLQVKQIGAVTAPHISMAAMLHNGGSPEGGLLNIELFLALSFSSMSAP